MMSSVARMRCSTCERVVPLAGLVLVILTGTAPAVEVWPSLRLGGGYLDNPFFDDDTLRATSPVGGPVGLVAPALLVRMEPGAHRVDALGHYRLTLQGGDEAARSHHGALRLDWRWPREAVVSAEVGLAGRYDTIDRFPADARGRTRAAAGVGWQVSPRVRLSPAVGFGFRDYPERIEPVEYLLDGGLALVAGPLAAGGVWSVLSAEARVVRTDGAAAIDRDGLQGSVAWSGHRGAWQAEAGVSGWWDAFATGREDRGVQGQVGLGRALFSGVVLGAEAHGLRGTSSEGAARYRQWGALVVLDLSTELTFETSRQPGVKPLPDGRWQFVVAAPGARRVELVGDFNDWRRGVAVLQLEDGLWAITVAIPPGFWTWMFVVDGAFVTPPSGPTRDDGFGRTVGVLQVPHKEDVP